MNITGTITITRDETGDHGTFGVLSAPGFSCFTAELPWRDNRPQISCIPAGEYAVVIRRSPKFGLTYWVKDVPGRSYVLIHSGNFAGDVTLGLESHVQGCILLGKKLGAINGQQAVLLSKPTVRRFMEITGGQDLKLIIRGVV